MISIILRTFIFYFILMFGIRLMGKRQIGDMQPGELVITILISEIAAIPIQDPAQPIFVGIVTVITLVFFEISISVITMKLQPLRNLFYGNSCIIIKDGILDQKMLKKLRVSATDLIEVLRNQSIFDINDVAYAILETNGQLSVLLKPSKQTITYDTECNPTADLPEIVVSDGKLIKSGLENINKNEQSIKKILKKESLSLQNVFIMLCDKTGKHSIIRKDKQ